MEEQSLAYGLVSSATKVGNTVRRAAGPWTNTIHELLRFLHEHGFVYAPQPLGFDEKGREILEFLPGDAAVRPWPSQLFADDGLRQAAKMLRQYHDIVQHFMPPKDAQWRIGTMPLKPGQIIRHGDLGPWNMLWQNGKLTGLIDWDFAEPGERITDLAQMAYYFVPLRGESGWQNAGFSERPDFYQRLDVLREAYGLFTIEEILDTLERWLNEELHRTLSLGGAHKEPWATFLGNEDDKEIIADLKWLEKLRQAHKN